MACGFAASCATIAGTPQSIFPRIELARVEVFADAGGLPAENVRTSVAEPIETALAALPGVRATRTFASTGRVEIETDFAPGDDMTQKRQAVQAIVESMRERLGITNVTVVADGPELEPVVTYAIVSRTVSQAELLRRVRTGARPLFVGTSGLGRLTIFAGPRPAYEIDLDAASLAKFGLSATDVAHAIAAANGPRVAGDVDRGRERLRVISGGALETTADLADVGIDVRGGKAVPLTALGRIRYAEEPTGTQASFDGRHAVLLNVYPPANGDAGVLARETASRMTALAPSLPADAKIALAWDQTRLVRASQRALRFEMLAGAAIALLVIGLFLRSLVLTIVAAIVLPVALAFTVAALTAAGLRLDLMTLGGLAIAIGLIVDEIIVVVEAIARELESGGDANGERGARVARAVKRIARPLLASTIANVVVFLPLAWVSGIPGFFFRALAITLSFSLAISIALSLTLAPSLVARGLRSRHIGDVPERAAGRVARGYASVVAFAMRRSSLVCGAAIAVFAASAILLVRTPTDFLPVVNEGQFEITYSLPPGTQLAEADRLANVFERTVLVDPAVAHVARLSGVDTNGYVATPPDAGTLRVTLKDGARAGFDEIADRIRERLLGFDPTVALEFHQLLEDQINDLSGAPEPVQLTVYGNDQKTLNAIAGKLADAIVPVRGLTDVFDGVTYEARSSVASPADESAPSSAKFATELADRISGTQATEIQTDGGGLPVIVHVTGGPALDRIARLAPPDITSSVTEENGTRFVRVTAGLEQGDFSEAGDAIAHNIAPVIATMPPGYRVEVGGTLLAQRTAFGEFAIVFVIALALLFVVLVATFDSLRMPLIVLSSIATMPIGVAIVLAATKTPLNVASFMGMLLLTGLVVRAGILLVDSARRFQRDGASAAGAMQAAARERLRPILMTTCATIGAVAPLAFGLGAGSEFERPLAVAVLGGIVTATVLTLVIVPSLYVSLSGRKI